jgi:hypothetical protein
LYRLSFWEHLEYQSPKTICGYFWWSVLAPFVAFVPIIVFTTIAVFLGFACLIAASAAIQVGAYSFGVTFFLVWCLQVIIVVHAFYEPPPLDITPRPISNMASLTMEYISAVKRKVCPLIEYRDASEKH